MDTTSLLPRIAFVFAATFAVATLGSANVRADEDDDTESCTDKQEGDACTRDDGDPGICVADDHDAELLTCEQAVGGGTGNGTASGTGGGSATSTGGTTVGGSATSAGGTASGGTASGGSVTDSASGTGSGGGTTADDGDGGDDDNGCSIGDRGTPLAAAVLLLAIGGLRRRRAR